MKEKLQKVKAALIIISSQTSTYGLKEHAVNSLALIDSILAELDSPELLDQYKQDIQKVLSEHGWADGVVESWGMDDELKEAMLDGMSAEDYAFEEMAAV